MYAVVRVAGQQVRAEVGERIHVPRLALEEGTQQDFSDVLLVSTDQGQTYVGSPTVEGAVVKATVQAHGRGKKIVVFKMKRRKGYRRRNGHRQDYTELLIDDIALAN